LERSDISKGINTVILIHQEALPNYEPFFQQVKSDKHEGLHKGNQR